MQYELAITKELAQKYLDAVARCKADGKDASRASFYHLVGLQMSKLLGEPVTYVGFLAIVRDNSFHCHFALGTGTPIQFYGKEPEREYELCAKALAGEPEEFLAAMPWTLKFQYKASPRESVFKNAEGMFIKSFVPGRVTKMNWPKCPTCGGELGMANREDTCRTPYWICAKDGEVPGEGMSAERAAAQFTVTADATEAFKVNRYEIKRMTKYLPGFMIEKIQKEGADAAH